jgi:hypothetical protein
MASADVRAGAAAGVPATQAQRGAHRQGQSALPGRGPGQQEKVIDAGLSGGGLDLAGQRLMWFTIVAG